METCSRRLTTLGPTVQQVCFAAKINKSTYRYMRPDSMLWRVLCRICLNLFACIWILKYNFITVTVTYSEQRCMIFYNYLLCAGICSWILCNFKYLHQNFQRQLKLGRWNFLVNWLIYENCIPNPTQQWPCPFFPPQCNLFGPSVMRFFFFSSKRIWWWTSNLALKKIDFSFLFNKNRINMKPTLFRNI